MSNALLRRINLAAASLGESSSEYVRNAVLVALNHHTRQDPALAAHFRYLDDREGLRETENGKVLA
jgi:hypothetical protein